MKTSELRGDLLDYWVARAEGHYNHSAADFAYAQQYPIISGVDGKNYQPSLNWTHGGPIIERESICLTGPGPAGAMPGKEWSAHIDTGSFTGARWYFGKTALEAAMRCYVASKFGGDVPDEISK